MNAAALEAALPGFCPGVLTAITSSSQVYVGDRARAAGASQTGVELLWQKGEEEARPDAGGLGLPRVRLRYTATLMGASLTYAQRKQFVREVFAAFHGKRAPTGLSDLHQAEVGPVDVGPAAIGQDPGPGEAVAVVIFEGDVTTSDAGA